MNQTTKKTNSSLREHIFCILYSLFLLVALFFLLTYLIYKTPNFDAYYTCFPFLLLLFEAIAIILFCMRYSARSVHFTLVSTLFVSLLSIVPGLIFFGFSENLLKILALHVVFVLVSTTLQLFIQKRKPKKRKNLPFKK